MDNYKFLAKLEKIKEDIFFLQNLNNTFADDIENLK